MNHPHQNAMHFLALHGGACSVPSSHTFADAFRDLQQVGKVTIEECSTEGYFHVRAKPEDVE